MSRKEVRRLVAEADRLRVEYLDAVNRDDLESALRIGAEQLVPVSERLVDEDETFLDPLGITLRNLAAICHRLQRPIGALRFVQGAFYAASMLDSRGLAIHHGLTDVGSVTATAAATVAASRQGRGALPGFEQEMVIPASALVPRSIELMGRLDSFPWACQLRLAATKLRKLGYHSDVELVDNESTSMVWLARIAVDRGDRDFALAEIGEALDLWITQLSYERRYWSTQLRETWTVAADLLDAISSHVAATSVRRAIQQAVGARQNSASLAGMAAALDLTEHYRAARTALR